MRRLCRFAAALALAAPAAACSSKTDPPPVTTDPSELTPPDAGKGFQIATDDVAVPAGNEEQDCFFYKVSDVAAAAGLDPTKPINLHRIQTAQRKGSHHMNVFRVKTIVGLDPTKGSVKSTNGVGECFKSSNWADWPLVANSQVDGLIDWTYPDGVVNKFEPDEWLMLQTHFVNASTQKTPTDYGKVRVNFWTVPDAEAKYQLGTLFATKQSIRVCQKNPHPTFDGSCQINSKEPVHIIGANGHFHSRGKGFDMYAWDGTSTTTPATKDKFYESLDWADPPMLTSPKLDVTVQPGAGIWYSCSYDWVPPSAPVTCDTLNQFDADHYGTAPAVQDCCYTFGPIVEKNEHCNAFVYYWPKADDVNCF